MKLSTKMVLGFLSVALILTFVGIAGFWSIGSLTDKTRTIIETSPLIDAAMEMKMSIARDKQEIMEMLASLNMEELDESWSAHEENVKNFDIYANAIMVGAETSEGTIFKAKDERLIKIVKDADEFHNKSFQPELKKIYSIMDDKINGKAIDDVALSKADKYADEIANKMIEILGEIEELSKTAMNNATDESNNVASASKLQSILGIVIGVVLSLVLGILLTRSISAPINTIVKNLSDSSTQVASASDQISAASQQLSEAASEQASSIEETSASLEEISGMVNNNVEYAERSNEISDKVISISNQGNESMENLIRSMAEIMESNEKIQDLVKVIGEIGEKTAVIDEIVFQTKLLSFNASVEAERAGEHGRGFAVVAQEVGNLAQMSGKAAQEISSIVKNSIKNAEIITSENRKKVEKGNVLVQDTAKILKDISENSATVSSSAKQILSASKEQAGGINQINKAMTQLDKATQENASSSEEVAGSSEELSGQAESLNQLISSLSNLITGNNGTGDAQKGQVVHEYKSDKERQYKGGRVHVLNHFRKDSMDASSRRLKKLNKPSHAKVTKAVGAAHDIYHDDESAWEEL